MKEICFLFGLLGGFLGRTGGSDYGKQQEAKIYQAAAVKRGYAEYNQTTGQWRWKPNPEQQPEKEPTQ